MVKAGADRRRAARARRPRRVARLCGRTARRLTLVEGARYPGSALPRGRRPRQRAAAGRSRPRSPPRWRRCTRPTGWSSSKAPAGCWCASTRRARPSPTLPAACGAEVLVVTAAGLGTLNATALTLEALAHRGLRAGRASSSAPGRAEPDLACRQQRRRPRDAGRPAAARRPAGGRRSRSAPAAFAAPPPKRWRRRSAADSTRRVPGRGSRPRCAGPAPSRHRAGSKRDDDFTTPPPSLIPRLSTGERSCSTRRASRCSRRAAASRGADPAVPAALRTRRSPRC